MQLNTRVIFPYTDAIMVHFFVRVLITFVELNL